MEAIQRAKDSIETALVNSRKLVQTTRLYAVTMDDAVTRLEQGRATMSNLMEGRLEWVRRRLCIKHMVQPHHICHACQIVVVLVE